ncbi:hypothetical protein HPB50_022092 [Hyalomma asiaticum]|uniref:Uncharacterized protein n=1 Tax=Hyalomma asiaticum TaxID=266040 RepID=A0ACB7TP67_HYAAI|nr:hypothetical protein HPB50_022092 [Hyalomma asiaticum]
MSLLDQKPAPPELRDATTGKPVSDILEHRTRHMAQLYESTLLMATEEHYDMSAPESIQTCAGPCALLGWTRALPGALTG